MLLESRVNDCKCVDNIDIDVVSCSVEWKLDIDNNGEYMFVYPPDVTRVTVTYIKEDAEGVEHFKSEEIKNIKILLENHDITRFPLMVRPLWVEWNSFDSIVEVGF